MRGRIAPPFVFSVSVANNCAGVARGRDRCSTSAPVSAEWEARWRLWPRRAWFQQSPNRERGNSPGATRLSQTVLKLPLAVHAPRYAGDGVQDKPVPEADVRSKIAPSVSAPSNTGIAQAARLPLCALAVWALLAFLVPSFVQALNLVDVLAFPLGYFMAAQGILLGLLMVAVVSARWQNRRAIKAGGRT